MLELSASQRLRQPLLALLDERQHGLASPLRLHVFLPCGGDDLAQRVVRLDDGIGRHEGALLHFADLGGHIGEHLGVAAHQMVGQQPELLSGLELVPRGAG